MLPQPPLPAVTAAQARALDAQAAARFGISTRILMENAGARCADLAHKLGLRALRMSDSPRAVPTFLVVCGAGGNGGDGYVAARHLLLAGARVKVQQVHHPKPGTDAADARDAWLAVDSGGNPSGPSPTVVVDAILGTGLTRPVDGEALAAVMEINAMRQAGAVVLSIDIPSGLDTDTGAPLGSAVIADLTATIAARKRGLQRSASRPYRGRVVVVGFGAPGDLRA